MYAILWWITDDYVTFVHNENGSIRLFENVNSADIYANQIEIGQSNSVRVICIEGVEVW